MKRATLLSVRILLFTFLAAVPAATAQAQERPAPAIEFAAGSLLFPDDGTVTEGFVGGAGRIYLSPRISVGPEIAFVQGQNHSHLMLTGNVTFDLVRPAGGQLQAVTPFLVVGGGMFQTREEFPRTGTYTSADGAFTAGGGVRASIGRKAFAGAEARIGWETHLRVNGFFGFRFGA